jgi:hypothetical protein
MRRFTFLALVMGATSVARAQRPAPVPVPTSGFSYTLTATADSPTAKPGVTGGPGSQSYVAHATVVGTRGRMDIVDGGVPEMFGKGDYLLFDSSEVVIVHPAAANFALLTQQAKGASGPLDTAAFTLKLSDEKVTLDSLGPGDTVSTFPTTRYRLTIAFNMELTVAMMASRVGSEAVTDYWVASIPGMASNPLLRSNGMGGNGGGVPGMLHALSLRVDSATTRMGRTMVLRSSSTTRIIAGPGQELESHSSTVVSDLKRAPVDRNSLIVPIQYKVLALPGLPADSLGDGAKWKVPPPSE